MPAAKVSHGPLKFRQDDAAGIIGVSESFLGKIEHGSDSIMWDKLFQVLDGLGIRVILEVPEHVEAYMAEQKKDEAAPVK